MEQEKLQLQQQALSLSQRLEAVLSGKVGLRAKGFDSDTPIDKAQAFLQDVIKVCSLIFLDFICICSTLCTTTCHVWSCLKKVKRNLAGLQCCAIPLGFLLSFFLGLRLCLLTCAASTI